MELSKVAMTIESEQRRLKAIINALKKSSDKSYEMEISIQGLELSLEQLNEAEKTLREVK